MATHSCILAWKTPWTEEPDGLQYMGLQKGEIARCLQGHDWATEHTQALYGSTPRNLEREGDLGSIFADHGFLDSSHLCPICQQWICVVAQISWHLVLARILTYYLFTLHYSFPLLPPSILQGKKWKHHLISVRAPGKEWVSELNLNRNPHILDPRVCGQPFLPL